MLDWAQICARLQRCDQFMNGVSNQVHQHNTGRGHNSFSITSCMRQFGAHSLFRALCDTFDVLRGYTLSSHAWKSPVNHQNHWCATLRDWTSCSPFHIWITKGRKPVFSDNHFNTLPLRSLNTLFMFMQMLKIRSYISCAFGFWNVWLHVLFSGKRVYILEKNLLHLILDHK